MSNSDAYTNLIAYALKGPSLPIVTLHAMLDDLQNALHRHGLNVLVECFDGQWANLCFKDCAGNPLTLYELQWQTWLCAGNLSQKAVLSRLMDISDVAASDVTKCTELAHSTKQLVSCGNLHILKSQGGAINIETNGGHLHGHCLMSSASFGNICINAECLGKIIMNEKEHTTDKSKFGQHDTILALLPEESRLELELEVLQVNPKCTELGEISLMHYLSTEKLPLLQDMVNTLQRE